MYNSQETARRIKLSAKEQGISILDLLENCNLGVNALSQSAKSQEGMKAKNLYTIADYLDCSVDYLLGRTDNPNINENNINNIDTTINGTQANIIHNAEPQDEMTTELLRAFKAMSFSDKMDVMNFVLEKAKNT